MTKNMEELTLNQLQDDPMTNPMTPIAGICETVHGGRFVRLSCYFSHPVLLLGDLNILTEHEIMDLASFNKEHLILMKLLYRGVLDPAKLQMTINKLTK